MKKLFIGLAALFVLLSFSGCKKDVPVSTVELQQAFYVTENPENKEWDQVLELPRTTDFTALKKIIIILSSHCISQILMQKL